MAAEGAECELCEGFGHLPRGAEPGWYARDWRLLLDPTVEWVPCPRCRRTPPLARLHEQVSRALVRRIDDEVVEHWPRGAWRQGVTDQRQEVWRWRDVALLPPGPEAGFGGWLLASALGVQRGLRRAELDLLLERMGAPVLPLDPPDPEAEA